MSEFEKFDHVHDENCDCGCDHDHEDQMMTLVLDDDSELNCHVVGVFEALDRSYIALVPDGEEEALIYRYNESDNEEGFELENIEDDEEFEAVEDVLFQLLDEEDDWEAFDDDDEDEVYQLEEEE